MLLLHGGLYNDRFVVWAEQSIGTDLLDSNVGDDKHPTAVADSDDRNSSAAGVNDYKHPFCGSSDSIVQALTKCGFVAKPDAINLGLKVWLPTAADLPMPSSRLLCDDDYEFQAADKLSLWSVEAIELSDMALVELVEGLHGSKVLSHGVVIGGEFEFLCALAKFAASLVVEQQYLPSMVGSASQHHARWQPLFSPQSHLDLRHLASAMPEVIRAIRVDGALSADAAPFELAKDYVSRFVDQAVRAHSFDVVKYIVMSKGKYLSNHDCWLHSLCTADGAMKFESDNLKLFCDRVKDWQKPLRNSEFSQFRLCFRLEEPIVVPKEEDVANDAEAPIKKAKKKEPKKKSKPAYSANGVWHVSYLLEDINDPSLLLSAKDCWSNNDVYENFSNADVHPREQLLRSLGQAARLSEEIDRSLRNPTPNGYELSQTDALEFLKKTAPVLQQAGFSVLLPAWWKSGKPEPLKRKGEMELDPKPSASVMRMTDVVKFDWQVALAGTNLSLSELKHLASLKSPLIHIRGRWAHVSAEDLEASINFLESEAKEDMTVAEVVQQALQQTDKDGSEIELNINGPLKDLLTKLEQPDSINEIPAPKEFAGVLRPYQQRGFTWLNYLAQWGYGACLADDMGLGKTIQTLALIQYLKTEKKSAGPVLLICPTSVVSNWRREIERFAPDLSVMIHHGSKRANKDSFAEEAVKFDMVISTYGLLHRDVDALTSLVWSGVIMDEAQNLKNEETHQAKSARALKAGYRIALTGTPIENSLTDLYSLMDFLNPNSLGSSDDFYKSYLKPIQVESNEVARVRLKRKVKPFILRRLKTDKSIITDLPDKIESKVYCSLTKEQVSLYSAVYEDLERQLLNARGPLERLTIVMGGLMRLKQVCNHPAHFLKDNSALEGRSGKLDRLIEMIDEVLQSSDKALIFTQFVEMGKLIKQHLQDKFGVEVLFLHGGINRKQRDELIERFQSADGPKLFILSVKAGGTGINLTAANHVFHFDRWWNPAVENQASDRAYRIGQTKNVQVHKFITSGTLEDKIDLMITKKLVLASEVITSDESWLAKLSADQLHDILALGAEAYD